MRRTVLGEKVVRSSDDELVDLEAQLLEARLSDGNFLLGSVSISSLGDRVFELLAEFVLGAEVPRITEVEETEVLAQIVLEKMRLDEVEGACVMDEPGQGFQ
jgi:hypothetical protein